jgi:hypothetical protein
MVRPVLCSAGIHIYRYVSGYLVRFITRLIINSENEVIPGANYSQRGHHVVMRDFSKENRVLQHVVGPL